MAALQSVVIDKHSSEPPPGCPASKLTWNCGSEGEDIHFHDRKWRYEIYQKYPKRYALELARTYKAIYREEGRYAANCELRLWDSKLSTIDFKLARNEEALKSQAEELAIKARNFALKPDYKESRLRILKLIALEQGLDLPDKDEQGILARLSDPAWWRRNLRKKHRCGLERIAIALNLVSRLRGIYVSEESLNCHRQQKSRNIELLKSMRAINELEQEFSLEELVNKSTSNHAIRRAELMVRIAGHDEYALEQGHIGAMFTITCPSRMHASWSKSGMRNSKYDNTSPKEAQAYLNGVWSRIRSKLDRDGIFIHGVRVAEPNHDGTPHWHLLVFMKPVGFDQVNEIIRRYALEDSPNDKNAQEVRVTYTRVDRSIGSAAGYIAKYISKNIDGHGVDKDDYGNSAATSAERVNAWASTWRIRQFQFFGSPPVSVWRESRRIRPESLPPGLLLECCLASDNNDWCGFMKLMGGHEILNKDRPIKLLRVWTDEPGKYGEPLGYVTKGLECDGVSYISRVHTWRIESRRENKNNVISMQLYAERKSAEVSPVVDGPTGEETQNLSPLEFCQ